METLALGRAGKRNGHLKLFACPGFPEAIQHDVDSENFLKSVQKEPDTLQDQPVLLAAKTMPMPFRTQQRISISLLEKSRD